MAADGGGFGSLRRDNWVTREAQEFVTAYRQKELAYYTSAEARGLKRIWEIAYCQYYGLNPNAIGDMATQMLAFVGENNQFLRFRINEFRSFIKQQIAMARGERPAFMATGINTDYATMSQLVASDEVIGYLYQTGTGETMELEALEGNAVVGLASAHVRWDFDGGDEVDVEMPHPDGELIPVEVLPGMYDMQPATITTKMRSGMPYATLHYPWELPRDPNVRGGKHRWRAVQERISIHELIEMYPDHEEELLSMQYRPEPYMTFSLFGFDLGTTDDDDVILTHVYVAPSKELPRGRYVPICQDIALDDMELPIDEIPIVDLCSARYMGSSHAYCDNWDLIAPNEMMDQMYSDGASNFTKFSRPMIVAEEGLQLDQKLLARGHYIWTKPATSESPQAVKIDPMPPGFLEFLGNLHQRQAMLAGLNSSVRGEPDKNITSGQMAALYHSQAIEFRSSEQQALYAFRKGLANMFLDFVRRYAAAPFLVEVAGKSERPYLKEISADTLSGIKRVIIEPVSSLARSTAGRLTVAELLMKVEDPKMRAALLKGVERGQWGDFCRKERNSDLRVQWENEQLAQGIACRVLASDNPFEHIPQHLADIDARSEQLNGNPEAVRVYLEHVFSHLVEYQNLDPNLARVLQIPEPLPIMGTPAGLANQMLTGPVQPVPQPGQLPAGATRQAAKASAPMQGRDSSGVKLPNPSSPPKGSGAPAQAPGAAPPRAA